MKTHCSKQKHGSKAEYNEIYFTRDDLWINKYLTSEVCP